MIREIKGGICAVKGVKAYGIKEGKKGLAIIAAKGKAAGVYTRNKIIAAPVIVTREKLETNGGFLEAVIINSGNANAFTGEQGLTDAGDMADTLARKMGIDPKFVAVASTGVIGRKLHIDVIKEQTDRVLPHLGTGEKENEEAMKAIMTTDLVPKGIAVEVDTEYGTFHVGGIAKGSGMIEPNMGTMLAFVYTDLEIDKASFEDDFRIIISKTFNMIVVDGDTSTNDMCLITATGQSGVTTKANASIYPDFLEALETVLRELAKMIARDGEGATKLVECTVTSADNEKDAVLAAKSIVRSPLVKSAVFGNDPNWGRIVAAAGYSGAEFDQHNISLALSDGDRTISLVEKGRVTNNDDAALAELKRIMAADTIYIRTDLGAGSETATAWGCDLTYDYVKINADYTT